MHTLLLSSVGLQWSLATADWELQYVVTGIWQLGSCLRVILSAKSGQRQAWQRVRDSASNPPVTVCDTLTLDLSDCVGLWCDDATDRYTQWLWALPLLLTDSNNSSNSSTFRRLSMELRFDLSFISRCEDWEVEVVLWLCLVVVVEACCCWSPAVLSWQGPVATAMLARSLHSSRVSWLRLCLVIQSKPKHSRCMWDVGEAIVSYWSALLWFASQAQYFTTGSMMLIVMLIVMSYTLFCSTVTVQ